MKRIVMAAMLALAAVAALPGWTGNARGVHKQVESSLLVGGSIVIDTDGTVYSHELDPKAQLTPALAEFIGKSLGQWRFEPVKVGGVVVRAKVPMNLRLVARQSDNGDYTVNITNTYFGGRYEQRPQEERVRPAEKLQLPEYPKSALRARAKGVVYLVAQIGSDGKVMQVEAEQVNLGVLGSENQMRELRSQFTDAARRAARHWQFNPPTAGEAAGRDSWLIRVPVVFRLYGEKEPGPGEWEAYVPGPRNTDMPWARKELETAGSPDALPENGVYSFQEGAKLLTPPAA